MFGSGAEVGFEDDAATAEDAASSAPLGPSSFA